MHLFAPSRSDTTTRGISTASSIRNLEVRSEIVTGDYTQYVWDQANRPIAVGEHDSADALSKKTSYFYDSQSKTDANGNPTDDVVLVFDDSGNLTRRYFHGPGVDQILAEDVIWSGGTETYWTFADQVGTIRSRVAYDGSTDLARWSTHTTFDGFGEPVGEAVTPVCRFS